MVVLQDDAAGSSARMLSKPESGLSGTGAGVLEPVVRAACQPLCAQMMREYIRFLCACDACQNLLARVYARAWLVYIYII